MGELAKKMYNYLKYKHTRVPHSKQAFVLKLPPNARLLDVGCGNGSPMGTKRWRDDIYYCGIDVGDYNQTNETLKWADEYIISTPEDFAKNIMELKGTFDGIISNHNIEHCNKPKETIEVICSKLKPGGRLHLAFPSEESVNFPSREGTLNFYDDPTHIWLPNYKKMIQLLKKNGMKIIFARKQYKPLYIWLWGGITERKSRKLGKVLRGTWAWWGFETVIWAEKL